MTTRETAYVFLFSAKNSDISTKHPQSTTEKSIFQFCLTITEPFSPFYLEEMKRYLSPSVSRTVSQVIMRVRKPTVAYKLVLQEKPMKQRGKKRLDVLV